MKHTNSCILNVGYYRTGAATLAKAAELVGYKVHRCTHVEQLDAASLKLLLVEPVKAVSKWWNEENGKQEFERLVVENDFVYGGFVPWLIMLPDDAFDAFMGDMKDNKATS